MQFAVRVLASTVTVDLDDSLPDDVRDRIVEQWAHLREEEPREPTTVMRLRMHDVPRIFEGDHEDVAVVDATSAPDALASRITLFGLRELSGHAFLLHAAGLATDDGSVIALVGPSGRGKTTASRALGQSMGYVTDETVAFDADGIVTPYPKPLSIGRRPTPKVLYPPAEMGLTVTESPLRLGALVLLERETGRSDVSIEHVPFVDALAELAPQSSSLWKMPSALSRLADLIARTGGVRRVRYGDAEQLPAVVSQILAARAVPEQLDAVQVAEADPDAGPLARAPYADAMACDDRLVVIGADGLRVLTGLGPAIWLAADGVSDETMQRRVAEMVGPTPDGVDPEAAIAEAVAQLRENRLLR